VGALFEGSLAQVPPTNRPHLYPSSTFYEVVAMLIKLAFLIALTVSLVAAALEPTLTSRSSFANLNPTPEDILNYASVQKRADPKPQLVVRGMTNARRLAEGLPLLPPKKREHAARSAPSSTPPELTRGLIEVWIADTGVQTGFIAQDPNQFGEYTITSSAPDALIVQFDRVTASIHGPVNIPAENGIPNFPLLGAVTGFASTSDNLGSGSSNYAYVVGTNETPVNSHPASVGNSFSTTTGISEDSESAIWSFSFTNGHIEPQWVNTDGSQPSTVVVFSQNTLVVTGDLAAFTTAFGGEQVYLEFSPI